MPPLSRPAPGNPRVQRTRARIMAVARDLLSQVGAAGLTYSRLAEEAGVTRQTLYRHWPARSALLVDLILDGPDLFYPEPGTDPAAVITDWLVSLRAGLNDPARRSAVLAVTAAADHDPDSAQAVVRLGADRLAALNQLMAPSGREVTEEEYTFLYGPVLSRLFFERRDVSDEFIRDIVTRWRAMTAPAQAAG